MMSCASSSLVSLNQVGSVELYIVNELTGQQVKRLLSDVYYLPDAPANLLSQDYMQTGNVLLQMCGACFNP